MVKSQTLTFNRKTPKTEEILSKDGKVLRHL